MYVVAVGSRNELKMGKEADLLQAAVKAGDVVTVQKILCKATSNSKSKFISDLLCICRKSPLMSRSTTVKYTIQAASLVPNSVFI